MPKENLAATETINAVRMKLSPFSTQEPVSWFRRAEIQFRLRKITDTHTQGDYVLESIPDCIFAQISSWLDEQADVMEYAVLKQYLLQEFTITPSARAQRLLSFPQQPLGDRTAHAVWHEMQALARLPYTDPVTNQHQKVDLMRELWLQTLPSTVRAAIHDSDSLPMLDLVKRADDLLNATKASQSRSTVAAVEGADSAINAMQRGRSLPADKSKRPQQFRAYLLPNGVCNYHDRFGDAARNCVPGCKWSKN